MELLVVPSSPEGHDRKEEPRKKEIGKAGLRIGAPARAGPEPHCSCGTSAYLLETPRAIFFTFFFFSPRAPVRLALGATFLRAARFSFFRSSLSSILVVSATWFLFRSSLFGVSRRLDIRDPKNNRVCEPAKAVRARQPWVETPAPACRAEKPSWDTLLPLATYALPPALFADTARP